MTNKFGLVIEISVIDSFEKNISYDTNLNDLFHFCSEQSLHSLMINQNYIIVKGGAVSRVQGGRLKDTRRLF